LRQKRALSQCNTAARSETIHRAGMMATNPQPTIIKKYANRRLYHTGTSTYVTLEDLAVMVKKGEDFVVTDAKTGEDITRSVLTQIIFELESKEGQQTMLPVNFLRQLIGYYGDRMEGLVPSYLEHSMKLFAQEQQHFQDHVAKAMKGDVFGAMQDQARSNMAMFQEAFRMFSPMAATQAAKEAGAESDVEALKKDLKAMQERLERMGKGG
jgi:polyhydroxyalkanoate synthesis repressor PhaR